MRLSVRFGEYEFYDPWTDREMVRLTATENLGTWHADIPLNGKSRVEQRRQFRESVRQRMVLGQQPMELELDD